jgi:PPM family protein phosphatase
MSEARSHPSIRVAAAGRTDVGRRRKHNEDSLLVRPELGLYVVADGMGGHRAGEVASAMVARSMEDFFAATEKDGGAAELTQEDPQLALGARRLIGAARRANRDVHELSRTRQQHAGMGSTLVALYLSKADRMVHICHVGDSRCYRIREEQIEQLTRDHSLINDALALEPDLTPELLAELPKNVITRAIGATESIEVGIRSEPLQEQDLFVLCTDGLSGLVTAEQLLEMSSLTTDLEELCELLVVMANEAGGPDNISVLALRVDAVLDEHPTAAEPAAPSTTEEVPAPSEPLRREKGGGEPPPGPAEVERPASLPRPDGAKPRVARPPKPVCATCGCDIGEGHRYCIVCGGRVAPEPAGIAPVFCHGCGAKLVPGGRFCPACGTRVA